MKWKNIDIGPGYYYITATFAEWLPLLGRRDVRAIVCDEITRATAECEASIAAFVLMPEHLHLLVYLPKEGLLHRYYKLWRGRSARKLVDLLRTQGDAATLAAMARHANRGCRYAVWKEQVRALAVWSDRKLSVMMDYIHSNPIRRGLVDTANQWEYSSFRFYYCGEPTIFEVVPMVS